MTPEERVQVALNLMQQARKAIERADLEPDPGQQRRLHVAAALLLRQGANSLDDNGRLSL